MPKPKDEDRIIWCRETTVLGRRCYRIYKVEQFPPQLLGKIVWQVPKDVPTPPRSLALDPGGKLKDILDDIEAIRDLRGDYTFEDFEKNTVNIERVHIQHEDPALP